MSQLALYGFVRKKDGLRTKPKGVAREKCELISIGDQTAAVVSGVHSKYFKPNPQDLLRHEEAVAQIFNRQVILPAKFPKIIGQTALERSMHEMETDLKKVLQRIVYKSEYQIAVLMTDPAKDKTKADPLNAFSRFIMERNSQYKYKHYFPLLTHEGKEAEFVDYAETVVKHISQELCAETTYWRGKSFQSDKILLKSFFWVRKHKSEKFEERIRKIRLFYPNLRFSVLGPTAPYNFVQLEFAENI